MSFITAATKRVQKAFNVVIGKELAGAEVGGYRSYFNLRSDENLTVDKIYGYLRSAEFGQQNQYLDLAEAIITSKDPQCRNLLATRHQALNSVPLEVVSVGKNPGDEESAELNREVLSGDWMAGKIFDMQDGVFKGYSVSEVIWDYNAKGQLLPVDIIWRDPKFFRFDVIDKTTMYIRRGMYSPTTPANEALIKSKVGLDGGMGDIPISVYPNNFIVHIPKSKSGIPIKGGLAMAVAYYYLFKNLVIKDWVAYTEKFGTPPIYAKYPKTMERGNIDQLYNMVVNMGKDMAGVFEQGVDLSILEHHFKSANVNIYLDIIHYIDDAMAKLILGQTLSSDTGQGRGSYALGAVHHAVRIDVLKSDAKQTASTLNSGLVKNIVDFNFGPRKRYCYSRFNVRENIDLQVTTNALQTLVSLGLKVDEKWPHEFFSIPIPPDDATLLVPPAPSASGYTKGGLTTTDNTGGVPKPGRPDGKNSPSEAASMAEQFEKINATLDSMKAKPTEREVTIHATLNPTIEAPKSSKKKIVRNDDGTFSVETLGK